MSKMREEFERLCEITETAPNGQFGDEMWDWFRDVWLARGKADAEICKVWESRTGYANLIESKIKELDK